MPTAKRGDKAVPPIERPEMDPETRAAFEASYRRNKALLDRLAKL